MTTDNYHILKLCAITFLMFGSFSNMYYDILQINITIRCILQSIGYISVPLYAFLEVKSFHYTEHRFGHLLKILWIGLLSEVPFSMMMTGNPLNTKLHNVCLTAFFGFVCLWICDRNFSTVFRCITANKKFLAFTDFCVKGLLTSIFTVVAHVFHAEYGLYAIPMLMILNGAEHNNHKKIIQLIAVLIWCVLQVFSRNFTALSVLLALPLIYALQDRKSICTLKNDKFRKFERYFYPLHLVIMTIVKIIVMMQKI